jgi:hypothetical protein
MGLLGGWVSAVRQKAVMHITPGRLPAAVEPHVFQRTMVSEEH